MSGLLANLSNESNTNEITTITPLNIEKVLGKTVKNGKLHYLVQIKDAGRIEIEEYSSRYVISTICSIKVCNEKLRIKGNTILLEYLRSDMLSKVPDHPALQLLSVTTQDSPTASTQAIRSTADGNWPVNDNPTSTITASTSNEATLSKKGSSTTKNLKQKMGRDKQPEAVSYEVEEINGHQQDNQARN